MAKQFKPTYKKGDWVINSGGYKFLLDEDSQQLTYIFGNKRIVCGDDRYPAAEFVNIHGCKVNVKYLRRWGE